MSSLSLFTRKYALSKTLCFELKPQGETLENMKKHLEYDENLRTFLKDQKIENAYQILKPILDFLHEKFITESMESGVAKAINFSDYFLAYRQKEKLDAIEKKLRSSFSSAFEAVAWTWKREIGNNEKGKPLLIEKGHKILTEKGILSFIRKNIGLFSQICTASDIESALNEFEGFFTYFWGFNKNRENYYETGKEASTAIATRVVHDNLPKFCDNLIIFESRKDEFLKIYSDLRNLGKDLKIKDAETGEFRDLYEITEDIFDVSYFSLCCLSQEGIERYNRAIWHYNALINLYNQAHRAESGFKKLSQFKMLYKQIGCGEKRVLFFEITDDMRVDAEKKRAIKKDGFSIEELIELGLKVGKKYFSEKSGNGSIVTVPDLMEYLQTRGDYNGIYWSKMAMNTISNKYFANYHALKDLLKQKKVFEKAPKGSEEDVKIPETIELQGLFSALDNIPDWTSSLFKKSILEDETKYHIISVSKTASEALLALILSDLEGCIKKFFDRSKDVVILWEYKTEKSKETLKGWLDCALSVTQILKYFLVKESKIKGNPIDATLTQCLEVLLRSDDATWYVWYDALRNYLTKKPQEDAKENKLKLNFENSTLAAGWDVNKESDNYCVILQNPEGKQFLSVITRQNKKGYNKIFEKNNKNLLFSVQDEKSAWKKMEYKLLPGPNKMLPKCLIPGKDRQKYWATERVLEIYDTGGFKKTEKNFSLENLHTIIDFYKSALKKYEDWSVFNFIFKDTKEYTDISQFYNDVEKQGYKIGFSKINKAILDTYVKEGKIYLFEIVNQDSNIWKKEGHINNLHTKYWNAVFSSYDNRPKLNGEAEIFYRRALGKHDLKPKIDKNGKKIIDGYRFSKEKFLFHVPITLNFCMDEGGINDIVNQNFSSDSLAFLGLDRGEKHLVYYSLVDTSGKLLEQGSFNTVNGKDYHAKLVEREWERDEARKNWQTIGNIKNLKEGYISQVVHEIVQKVTTKPTFIVLEDLNTGFKRGRQKIERQIYQKFELALAKKLNFVVDKRVKDGEICSVTNALQLTPPVQNYGDIENRKQVGIMLYTRANYTSQTDPATGWRKTVYLKSGSEDVIKKQIFEKFSDIHFEKGDYILTTRADKETAKEWKLYSGVEGKSLDRFRWVRWKDKNEWIIEKINITHIFDQLFDNAEFDKNRSLLSQMMDEWKQPKKISKDSAWESLRFAIDLVQQIRNSDGTGWVGDNFLLSPVRDEKGNHFDSRKLLNDKNATLPRDADANGAYNIARKGIIMNAHIQQWIKDGKKKCDGRDDLSLFISDKEWDLWLTHPKEWQAMLSHFSSRKSMEKEGKEKMSVRDNNQSSGKETFIS